MKERTIFTLAGAAMFIASPASAITTTVESPTGLFDWYKMIFGFILVGFTAWSALRILLIPAVRDGNQLGIKILVSAFCVLALSSIVELFFPLNSVVYRFGEERTKRIAESALTALMALNLAWNLYGVGKPEAYYLDDDKTARSAALMSAMFLATIYGLFWVD
jgi:hypothetical protein